MPSELARTHMASTWHRSYKTWAHLWSCLLWNPIDFSQAFGQQSKALYCKQVCKNSIMASKTFWNRIQIREIFKRFSKFITNWKNMSWNSRAVLWIGMHPYKIHELMLLWNGFKIHSDNFLGIQIRKKNNRENHKNEVSNCDDYFSIRILIKECLITNYDREHFNFRLGFEISWNSVEVCM